MKTKLKKTYRTFRIEADLDAELRKNAIKAGLSQTALLEESMRIFFRGDGMKRMLAEKARDLLKLSSSFNLPTLTIAA